MEGIKKHPVFLSILLSEIVAVVVVFVQNPPKLKEIPFVIMISLLVGIFMIYPIILTFINMIFMAYVKDNALWIRIGERFEYITVGFGILCCISASSLSDIVMDADWNQVLVNEQVHTPIFTGAWPTIIIIALVAIAGYIVLSFTNVKETPPLVTVTAMAAIYLGIGECCTWIYQVMDFGNPVNSVFTILYPLNCIIIAVKVIRLKTMEWKAGEEPEEKNLRWKWLNRLNSMLKRSDTWPFAAFILMWPLLGIIICILVLFGQQPDSIIKAWTETSDWNLSTKTAPQNVFEDEHYLCTVAAGGHREIVKPLRMGERHGHRVIVNRQLCIANAFEQVLEERTPSFHRHLRHFYDTYGFPVAKLIHSPYMADFVYFIMKPLEWIFLIVLYFTDVNPENRIAVQYLPKRR